MNGNAIIGQSGGPTSVINSSLCGVIQKASQSKNIDKIYGMRFAIEGFLNDEIIDLSAVDPQVIEGLRHTPGSALGSCRHKLQEEDLPVILELFKKYNIRYFFLIGGNDTMDTIHRVEAYCKIQNYDLIGVGVPKTVDNDLFGTDHTPGFASAARYVALSTQQGGVLASDMQRVDKFVIQQTVGRDAGWLAASSAMARKREGDAPHLIYIPERPLNREKVLSDVKTVVGKYGWASIVCGEGITWEDGTPVSASQAKDKFSNVEFGAMGGSSAALNLHQLISNEFGYRGEFQITESLPMSGIDRASEVDLQEAYDCGVKAVELADEGKTGVMVSIVRESNNPYKVILKTAPLSDVAIKAKPMPDEYIAESGADITAAFIDYLKPLIGEFPTYSILR
jgi:6-phosphofructokinase 1